MTAEDLKAKVGGNWQSTDAMGANRMSTFSYDNAQNRETASALGQFDDPTPNALNQPNTRFGAGVNYDADGNMISDGTWAYAYDTENRLKPSSKTGLTITYAYDSMGRRVDAARQRGDGVAKRSRAAPIPLMRERGECGRVPPGRTREQMRSDFGGWYFTKRFIWDGWHLLADIWPPEWGNGIASTYVWGIDVSGTVGGAGGVGGLAVVYYNSRAFLPLQDGRGNIHGYLDTTTGKNAVSWDFTAYGEAIHVRGGLSGQYGTQDFLFRYQSKMQDMEGHLLYFGHRYYHPGMGRFVNRDPIGESGGLNLYGYVRNGPVNKWDYLGLNNPDDLPTINLKEFDVRGIRHGNWISVSFSSVQKVFDSSQYMDGGGDAGFSGITLGNFATETVAAPNKQEEWKPTKENCDKLRKEYPHLFLKSDATFENELLAHAASTMQTALAVARERDKDPVNTHEYGALTFSTKPARFDSPIRLPNRTGGSVDMLFIGIEVWPYAATHAHNIGPDSAIAANPGLTTAAYFSQHDRFSPPDVNFVLDNEIPLGLYTEDHRMLVIGPEDRLTRGKPADGRRMPFSGYDREVNQQS